MSTSSTQPPPIAMSSSPKIFQRLVRRAAGPEAVRAGQEVLLVDRLQHHAHRPLEDLVLEGRYPDGPGLAPVAFGDVAATHRGGLVRARLEAVEQRPEVLLQCSSYSRPVWPSTPVAPSLRVRRNASCSNSMSMWWARLSEGQLRRPPGQFRYPLSLVETVSEVDDLRRLSLQRFRVPAPPFPPRGPSGRFPRFIGTIKALRLPVAPPASLRCLRSAVPRSTPVVSLSRWPAPARREPGPWSPVARPALFPRRPWGLPGSWGIPCRACRALRPRTSPMRQAIQRVGCCQRSS